MNTFDSENDISSSLCSKLSHGNAKNFSILTVCKDYIQEGLFTNDQVMVLLIKHHLISLTNFVP